MENGFRKRWDVKAVPQLVRYQRGDGGVREVGRLVEGEVVDEGRLRAFVNA